MTQYWGPRYWYFFHSLLANYPEEPTPTEKILYQQMFVLFVKLLPCTKCFQHFTSIVKAHPPNMNTKHDWVMWGYKIHNKVNLRLKKKALKTKFFVKMYKEINHQYLYDFIMYNLNRAYQNQIPYNDFLLLINLSLIVFPCIKCRKSLQYKYKKDNMIKLVRSKIDMEKWVKRHFKPNGYHHKKRKLMSVKMI